MDSKLVEKFFLHNNSRLKSHGLKKISWADEIWTGSKNLEMSDLKINE